jgi:hypothetical protein
MGIELFQLLRDSDEGGGGSGGPAQPPNQKPTPRFNERRFVKAGEQLENCIAKAVLHYLGQQALTGLKQIGIEAGVGLGIAFTIFFGAEVAEPVVEGGILIGMFIKLDSMARAASFAGAAAFVAGKYAVNNYKDLYRNMASAEKAVKACYAERTKKGSGLRFVRFFRHATLITQ